MCCNSEQNVLFDYIMFIHREIACCFAILKNLSFIVFAIYLNGTGKEGELLIYYLNCLL